MISLRSLPTTLRVLFSCFLLTIGIGYLTALSYLFLVDVEPHRKEGQRVVEGISEKYHGSTSGTRLEAALKGTMADKLTPAERDRCLIMVSCRSAYGIAPILARNAEQFRPANSSPN